MINAEIYDYSKEALIHHLRFEAGSSNPDYFHAKKAGGMKLQQVPEEYAELLLFLKDCDIKNYLALGIGNGGSFAMECFFMKSSLEIAAEVDNLAYAHLGIGQNEIEILNFIENVRPFLKDGCNIGFVQESTDEYFRYVFDDARFDCIFIDADHSYEGAKKDYVNSLVRINKGGYIIFHDINSAACPGIQKLWKEAKAQHKNSWEFVASKTCGIGVIQVK